MNKRALISTAAGAAAALSLAVGAAQPAYAEPVCTGTPQTQPVRNTFHGLHEFAELVPVAGQPVSDAAHIIECQVP